MVFNKKIQPWQKKLTKVNNLVKFDNKIFNEPIWFNKLYSDFYYYRLTQVRS